MALMEFTKIAIKNLFSKPATIKYPAEKTVEPDKSRGHVSIDIDSCIMCGICQRKCPSAAITVDKASKTWTIQRMGCVQCAYCVASCPKKCLSMNAGYTQPSTQLTVDSYSCNPENSEAKPQQSGKIVNDMSKCILCGLCARKCPQECITVDRANKTWSINRDACVQCGACIDACIKFKALSYTDDDGEKGNVTLIKE